MQCGFVNAQEENKNFYKPVNSEQFYVHCDRNRYYGIAKII